MGSIIEIQQRSQERDEECGRQMRQKAVDAGRRVKELLTQKDTLLAGDAGMEPDEFQQLILDEGRTIATGLARLMRNNARQGTPLSLMAARKAYEFSHQDPYKEYTDV